MIPFILGMICGFALAALLISLYALMQAASIRSREEEGWDEDRDISAERP